MANGPQTIGEEINLLRKQKRESISSLARQIEMRPESVGRILRGVTKRPSITIVLRLLGALGYTLLDEVVRDLLDKYNYTADIFYIETDKLSQAQLHQAQINLLRMELSRVYCNLSNISDTPLGGIKMRLWEAFTLLDRV